VIEIGGGGQAHGSFKRKYDLVQRRRDAKEFSQEIHR